MRVPWAEHRLPALTLIWSLGLFGHVLPGNAQYLNLPPVANPGGPYSGFVGVPLGFDGRASSDPDGDTIAFLWDFGDGTFGRGAAPTHTYFSPRASYNVALTVSDSLGLSDTATTTATIRTIFQARAFVLGSDAMIHLDSSKPTWCVEIEPLGDAGFLLTDVIMSSIALSYGGTRVFALPQKTEIAGDRDRNGVQEITACFSKVDLQTLFRGLPPGKNAVTVGIRGDLTNGALFDTDLTVDVQVAGQPLVASVAPNPLNPKATLTFLTSRSGRVSITLFNADGIKVRTLLEVGVLPAGYHDLLIDGRDERGTELASGVYFYRVETPEGASTGRFVVLK